MPGNTFYALYRCHYKINHIPIPTGGLSAWAENCKMGLMVYHNDPAVGNVTDASGVVESNYGFDKETHDLVYQIGFANGIGKPGVLHNIVKYIPAQFGYKKIPTPMQLTLQPSSLA